MSIRGVHWIVALGLAALPLCSLADQGVTKNEILIGTIQDLSGPLAAYSKESLNGMNMRLEEVNAAGGVHGRKVRLLVEDSGYDTKKAMLAAQKLAQSDKIFAVAGSMGTTIALTTQQVFADAGVVNLFPLGSARGLYEPPEMKFAFSVPYFQQGRGIVKSLLATKADRKWCSLVQDDDLGTELMAGVDSAMKEAGKTVSERTTYKRAATDFSSQVARLKSAGCDTVILGTTLRETVGTLNEAKKIGFTPQFVATSAAYSHLLPRLGGAVTEGIYASHSATQPYADEGSKATRDWYAAYVAKYKEEPGQFAVMGYAIMDWTLKAAEKAGADLSTRRFIEAMETSSFPRDKLGFDTMTFTKTKHLGSEAIRVSQLKNGKWTPVSDFITP
ncbi:Leucine-, isoleucine-, valine-, threonine-, and alanine-binding protein precursor [Variovorax sp. PBL-H6]|uniref:ABC transporter substrate-binding protein n=1 Tax=Variovorax sp. PBL-H6 TaxID=434009 RepID=UPI0013170DEB|nr:ABC transporter substrate-binding protein [Variovorax sp. PBL-H6]VTU24867.1 Leucine-, isoleucine-, valine-, threonine-, and alanine-binding protein precursor [Variovorax sp. PBL-H6]